MRRPATVANVLVIAVAILAYASTVNNYFVQDDFGVVWLLSQKPAAYFPQWFVSNWMDTIWGFTPDEVRPFPAVSYQIAAIFGAGIPFANHAINIAFHAGTALLVLQVARHAAGLGLPAATLAAVLFVLLPNQTETVAWITGRVDSMPALFYAASFLTYVRWRNEGAFRLYGWSVFWCFVALFSKQTAITLVPALVLYDVVVARRRVTVTWGWLQPYVPFIALTVGYLLLRYVLFGEIAREGTLTMARVSNFMRDAGNHGLRVVMGAENIRGIGGQAVAIACAAFLLAWVMGALRGGTNRPDAVRPALYFGIVWTALGIVPTLVSTYSSPRHAYLASMGWVLTAGIAFDVLWRARSSIHNDAVSAFRRTSPLVRLKPDTTYNGETDHGKAENGKALRTTRVARAAAVVGAAALLVAYVIELRLSIVDWNTRAALSEKAVADLERTVAGVPDGTLIVAGVTQRAWAFALPFAATPPFTRTDLTQHVSVISPSALHCCGVYQWDAYTRQRLRTWLSHPGHPPVIALHWDPLSGNLTSLSDANDPSLRTLIALLLESGDYVSLDANMLRLVNDFVAYHGSAVR